MVELLRKNLKKYLNYSLNLIYPLKCLICRKDIDPLLPRGICPTCFNKIKINDGYSFPVLENECYFKQMWSACPYEGIVKEAIHLFKYKGKLILARELSRLMAEYAQANIPLNTIHCLIPVPLHRSRLREREFNQSEVLSLKLAAYFNVAVVQNVLIRTRPTPPQVNLKREERFISLKGAFRVKKNDLVKGKNILLIDDVFTTGTTANECAKALGQAGADEVNVFTLARG